MSNDTPPPPPPGGTPPPGAGGYGTPAPPPPPPGGGYGGGVPGAVPGRNQKALISMILGIVGLLGTCLCGIFAAGPLGIAAIVLGVLGRNEIASKPGETGNGMALAGIILGVVALILSVVVIILVGSGGFEDLQRELENA